MKVLGIILLILITLPVTLAAIIISPGVSVTDAHQSEEKLMTGMELVSFDTAFGIMLETEWTFLNDSIGLNIGALWRGGEAVTQYSYTNPTNPLDTASVPDLSSNSSSLKGTIGPRFRFINMKYFKIFAGAGWTPGLLNLTYNENRFVTANGSIVGFKENEQQKFQGTYFETGLELHSSHGDSVRLLGRKSQQRTDRFETLGNKKINLKTTLVSIHYLHLF
jgi:hypothetical protein